MAFKMKGFSPFTKQKDQKGTMLKKMNASPAKDMKTGSYKHKFE